MINIKATNLELTEAIRNYLDEKLKQLDRHTSRDPINIDVEVEHLTTHKSGPVYRCEIMYEIPGEKFMIRGESVESDLYAAIDTCVPKVKEQLDKEREKREDEIKKGGRKLKEMIHEL